MQHPTYRALAELGKAIKTIFICEYLQSEALRREIHESLNVFENWNSANSFIFYGRNGEISTNRLDSQEIAVLSLHLLQISMVYILSRDFLALNQNDSHSAIAPSAISSIAAGRTQALLSDEKGGFPGAHTSDLSPCHALWHLPLGSHRTHGN